MMARRPPPVSAKGTQKVEGREGRGLRVCGSLRCLGSYRSESLALTRKCSINDGC